MPAPIGFQKHQPPSRGLNALPVAIALSLAVIVTACNGDEKRKTYEPPDAVLERTATITATPEPVSAEDAANVYAVVDALRTKDVELIRPYFGLRKIGCVANPTIGGPPKCASGESDGDQIDAFYFATCEGQYLRASELSQPLSILAQLDVDEAYRIDRKGASGYQYSVVLIDSNPEREGKAWEAIIDNGEIIGLLFSCALSAEDLIAARGYTTIVPTPAPTSATPGP